MNTGVNEARGIQSVLQNVYSDDLLHEFMLQDYTFEPL